MKRYTLSLAITQLVVRLQAEVPSGYFAWGCEVLEDKSLRVDQVSTEPLVSIVPWSSAQMSIFELKGHQAVCLRTYQLSTSRR